MNFLRLYFIICASISFGFTLAGILNSTGIIDWLGGRTASFSKLGLHPLLSQVPVLYLVSPRAAHLHMSKLLKEKKIEERDVLIATAASNLPLRLEFLLKYYFPVLAPLVGIIAVYYGFLRLFFDCIVFFIALAIGRRIYKKMKPKYEPQERDFKPVFSIKNLYMGLKEGAEDALSFLIKFTPVYIFVVYLIKKNLMEKLLFVVSPVLKPLGLGSLQITYVITAAVSPPVAYGFLKVMLAKGYPVSKILGVMFLGNFCFTVLRAWWMYLLPNFYGLYPKKVIAKLVLIQSFIPAFYNLTLGIILCKF